MKNDVDLISYRHYMKQTSKARRHLLESLIRSLNYSINFSRRFGLIAFFLLSTNLYSQPSLDSLNQIWQDESAGDSLRAEAYMDYIYDYFVLQKPDSALFHFRILYDFCKEKNLDYLLVQYKKMEGYHYFRTGSYGEAIASYDEGLLIADRINDTLGIAEILLRKGWIFHDTGQKIKALHNYQQSKNYFDQLNYQYGLLSVYNELGSIYRDEDDWEKSLAYYQKSFAIGKAHNYETNAALSNIAGLYDTMGQYDTALVYILQSLEASEEINDLLGIGSDLLVTGSIYRGKGETKKAIDYFQRSLAINIEVNNVQLIVSCLLELADIDIENRDFHSAINKCNEGLTKAMSIDDLDDQLAAYECLYEATKALGNDELALAHFEKVSLFEDSLQYRETTSELLEMEFAAKLKSDSLIQVEKDLKTSNEFRNTLAVKNRNRNLLLGGGIIFLLISLGLFIRNRITNTSKRQLEKDKARSDSILLNILPAEIAEELKIKGKIEPRNFDQVSILFTDFKSFTNHAETVSAEVLVEEINECFAAFDHICGKYKIEKIKTIGDAFMAAGGLPMPSELAPKNTVLAALEMQKFIRDRLKSKNAKIPFEMRLGIHTGPITAGIVGVKKFQYDLWGDTVNTASRMESQGLVNKVNISESTYQSIKNDPEFIFESRGKIEVKGKGLMEMYFVDLKHY